MTGAWKKQYLPYAAILAVVAASYFNAPANGFVTDDFGLVVDNPNIKSAARIPHVLASGYWDALGDTGGLYRPFTILSFLLEHSAAGLNPAVYHLDNVILHLACTVLAYLVLTRIFTGSMTPLFAALIFAAHPVHAEAVTWISGRAELLWAVFGFGSIYMFMKYGERPAGLAASVVLYTLSLFSKESGVVVLPLLAAWIVLFGPPAPAGKRIAGLAGRLWPYAAATAVFAAVRYYVIGGVAPPATEQAVAGLAFSERSLLMCRAFFEYLRLGFIPASLNVDYIFPPPGSVLDVRVMITLLLFALAAVFAAWVARRSRPLAFAGAWFVVSLLPVSNIIPTGIIMSERAMYFPSLGVCMVLASALVWIEGRKRHAGVALLAVVVGLFAVRTAYRNFDWKDQPSLSRPHAAYLKDAMESYPDYAMPYKMYAQLLLSTREYGPETEAAIREAYDRMAGYDPEVREMMSFVYINNSRVEESLGEILAAVGMDPENPRYRYKAAKLYLRMNRMEDAAVMIDEAVRQNPNSAVYRMLKGDILMGGAYDEDALAEYRYAAGLDPENHDAYLMQGIALDSLGRFGEAVDCIIRAVELRPDIPELRYFLAVAYLDAGMQDKAKTELEVALSLKPGYPEAVGLLEKIEGGEVRP